jgi:hypothetical protein
MPTHDYRYKNLVFEGGGVKGVTYGGVFEVLEQNKITPQIEPTLIGGGNFRRSPRSGRQHKVFHPSRDARLGTPAWGGPKRNPRNRRRKYWESAERPTEESFAKF